MDEFLLTTQNLKLSVREGFFSQSRDVFVCDDIVISRGESAVLLGDNGSGKTSFIRMALGLTQPTKGLIRVFGEVPSLRNKSKSKMGYMPERLAVYPFLTVDRFLRLMAEVSRLFKEDIDNAVSRVEQDLDLVGFKEHKLRTLSKGMLQRVGLAQALLHHPEFLLLDEPLSGLDRKSRREFILILTKLRERGVSFLVSSHEEDWPEDLFDRTFLIEDGSLKELKS